MRGSDIVANNHNHQGRNQRKQHQRIDITDGVRWPPVRGAIDQRQDNAADERSQEVGQYIGGRYRKQIDGLKIFYTVRVHFSARYR